MIDDDELEFIETTNEGDAVALASGAWLGGRKSVVMFQNSGLGNAINPLTSLSYTMDIPFIGIVTLRGELGRAPDEPQHDLMGKITTELLDLMEIPWAYFPTESNKIEGALFFAEKVCDKTGKPFFFVMKKGSVDSYELKEKSFTRCPKKHDTVVKRLSKNVEEVSRTDALRALKKNIKDEDLVIATTGKTGRELFEVEDGPNNLYMVGSMGCALPIGLGLSRTGVKETIYVVDGDGALLMRLGNMALAGQMMPSNIVHILLDNGVHDSTGGQRTFSEAIDFANISASCGYNNIYEVDNLRDFEDSLGEISKKKGLSFIRFMIKAGSPKDLGRPTVKPSDVALRMKEHIKGINERNNQKDN
ncbi:MAG: phosphonopyruvate decarboxylase [Bacteriovoracaceae bacterium]